MAAYNWSCHSKSGFDFAIYSQKQNDYFFTTVNTVNHVIMHYKHNIRIQFNGDNAAHPSV